MVSSFSDLEVEARQCIFEIIPELVCQLLLNPEIHIDLLEFSILKVLDLMASYIVGWSDELSEQTSN
tara:strand:+ start:473 stop:673 length:201 start_codon:yes stop_codon:yes gene_type:complete